VLHERWFIEDWKFPVQWEAVLTPTTWIPLGAALGITALAVLIWKRRGRRDYVPGPLQLGMKWENYQDLLSWMPLVIGVHTAVTLLVSGIGLRLLVPNLTLPENFLGALLGFVEIAVALSLIYGALTRLGAVALAVVWLAGAVVFGPVRLLERCKYVYHDEQGLRKGSGAESDRPRCSAASRVSSAGRSGAGG